MHGCMNASATTTLEADEDFKVAVEVVLDVGQGSLLLPSSLNSCMTQLVFVPLGARPL